MVTYAERELHEVEILKRLQPGLVHKNMAFENKTGIKNPMSQNE